MYQSSKAQRGQVPIAPRGDSPVSVIGAGIAGAWQALLFAQAGHAVTLHERSDAAMTLSTSHWAGGMLAPWCEAETSEPVITRLGVRSLSLWREQFPQTLFNGFIDVTATDGVRSDTKHFHLVIVSGLVVSTTSLPNAGFGAPYSASVACRNWSAPVIAVLAMKQTQTSS